MQHSSPPEQPVFIETPLTLTPQIQREPVFIDDRTIYLERPSNADRLLDDPVVHAANLADDYMPYWADIWPASRMMAKVILREPFSERLPEFDSITALELGCGLGLAGIAALVRGFHVIFSDYDLTALRFADRNARLNGFTNFETLPLDWRFPPEGLQVPLILVADLTYELRNIDPILALIQRVMHPKGMCLLTDPDRSPAPMLQRRLAEVGLTYSTQVVRAGEPGGDRRRGTLYRIRFPRCANGA